MINKKQTILLVTESSKGHHIAFMELFVLNLKLLGCDVVVLMPNSMELYKHMNSGKSKKTDGVIFEDYQNDIAPTKGLGKYSAACTAFRRWLHLNKTAKSIEKQHSLKIDLVFLAFADVYVANYLHYALVDFVFRYKWSGLYFHPKFLRYEPTEGKYKSGISSIDYVFKSSRCKAIGVHDDKLINSLTFRLDKPIVFFPEIADLTEPDISDYRYLKIKEKAKGRKIIGLVGCEKRKGFHTLVQLALTKPENCFFVFAGELSPEGYTEKEIAYFRQFLESDNAHVLYFPAYILEGREINSLLAALDIIYIVYSGFTSTSNFSTKAAFLRKPVLATEKYIIGDDTREFNLGVTVKENDLEDLKDALSRLELKIQTETFHFDLYLKKHNNSLLETSFESVLK